MSAAVLSATFLDRINRNGEHMQVCCSVLRETTSTNGVSEKITDALFRMEENVVQGENGEPNWNFESATQSVTRIPTDVTETKLNVILVFRDPTTTGRRPRVMSRIVNAKANTRRAFPRAVSSAIKDALKGICKEVFANHHPNLIPVSHTIVRIAPGL